MHPLLEQQLRQHFGWSPLDGADAERWGGAAWADFVDAIDAAYTDADARRALLEHALTASSQELMSADSELRTTLTTANLLKRQLQARAAEVEGILAGTPHPILVTDEEGTILRASAAVETLFG